MKPFHRVWLIFCEYEEFLCPCIDRSGAYSFLPVCLSAKTFMLSIAFEWQMIKLSYLTYVLLWVKPFLKYQSQDHLSRSRSNIKVTVFEKMAIVGAFMFHKHILFFSSTGHRPASLCHGLLSLVRPSVRPFLNFFFKHLLL